MSTFPTTILPAAIDRSATLRVLVMTALADIHEFQYREIRAQACANMIQAFCYAAYRNAACKIHTGELAVEIAAHADTVAKSWDGWAFNYEPSVNAVIGWLSETTRGAVS